MCIQISNSTGTSVLRIRRLFFYFEADPDPTLHSDADPNSTFQYDVDPDPAPHQSDANLPPLAYRSFAAPRRVSTASL